MRELEQSFEIERNGIKIAVSEHAIHGSRVFRLIFSDRRKRLAIKCPMVFRQTSPAGGHAGVIAVN
jgi:hypothetical protein